MTDTPQAIALSLLMVLAVIAGVTGATLAKPPGKGQGHGNSPLLVDDNDVECPNAEYDSIQNAVENASAGDTVRVCEGTYTEQVVVSKDLTLEANPGATPVIEMPADPANFTIPESGPAYEPIVFAYGGTATNGAVSGTDTIEFDLRGFVIDGQDRQPTVRRAVGVFVRNAEGAIEDNTVRDMAVGGKETMGVLVYGDSDVTIANNVVDGYERGGIGANGDGGAHPAPAVTIRGNTVNGSTGIGEAWGPNGIQVGFGAEGMIVDNVVRNNRWSETGAVASGILVFESDDVQIRGNTVENADAGIAVGSWAWFAVSADNTKIIRNSVTDANVGIALRAVSLDGFSMDNASVSNTKVVNNDLHDTNATDNDTGIQVATIDLSPDYDPIAANNKVINNDITGFNQTITDGGSGTKLAANEP